MDEKTALVVIDMQRGFIDENSPCYIKGAKATVPACTKLIDSCRSRNIPVFFVNRLYRADGSNVEHTRYMSWRSGGRPISPGCAENISSDAPEEFRISDSDYYIVKPRFSAFFSTELDLILRRLGINTILLAGTTTPNCIRTTCYDGISLEYNIVIVEDCTSSATDEIQQSNIRDMANIGAQIVSCEDFVNCTVEIRDNVSLVRDQII